MPRCGVFVRMLTVRIDPVVKKETLKIALGTLILSVVMELVFVILGKWDMTVLFGNLLGAFAAVLNFFLMGMTVAKCVTLDKGKAALKIRASQYGRLLMLAAFAALGALLPCFNIIAVIVPLLFPQLVIFVWQLTHREKKPAEGAETEKPEDTAAFSTETTDEDTEN